MAVCLCSASCYFWIPSSSTRLLASRGRTGLIYLPWNHYDAIALTHVILMAATWFMYLTYGRVSSGYGSSTGFNAQSSPEKEWPRKPPDPMHPLFCFYMLLPMFETSSEFWAWSTPIILLATMVVFMIHHRSFLLAWITLLFFCLELGMVQSALVLPWLPRILLPFYGIFFYYFWRYMTPLKLFRQVWNITFTLLALLECTVIHNFLSELCMFFALMLPWLRPAIQCYRSLRDRLSWCWQALVRILPLLLCYSDPPPSTESCRQAKRQQHRSQQRKKTVQGRRLRATLLAMMTIPDFALASQRAQVQCFLSGASTGAQLQGLLDTLNQEKLLALRSHLSDFGRDVALTSTRHQTKTHLLVVDSGASATSTPDKNDFEAGTYKTVEGISMAGISSGLPVAGTGILRYEMIADDGTTLVVRTWGYHIPKLPVRLMSPQVAAADGIGDDIIYKFETLAHNGVLHFWNDKEVTVPYNATNRLPILYVSDNMKASSDALEQSLLTSIADEKNQNLSAAQQMLLQWHQKLNHVGYSHIVWLSNQGYLGNRAKRVASLVRDQFPMCATCLYGKQARRPDGTKESHAIPERIGALKRTVEAPGDVTAMDQYSHSIPGRGASLTNSSSARYVGGTIFVDLSSGRIKCAHQTSLNSHETLVSKTKYEQDAVLHGVTVKRYHCDNGVFTARDFTRHVLEKGQGISYSGVGAKHQNGNAERAIKTVTYMARTMMLHAAIRWPEVYSPELWPYALTYACHIYNTVPRPDTSMSANELFSGVKEDHFSNLSSLLPWGIPAYVLAARLQDGGTIGKWSPRSRRGQFVGVSEFHCQKTVGLIRNLITQHVSPQFHVVYDAWFHTAQASDDVPPKEWEDLVIYSRFECPMDFHDEEDAPVPRLREEWLDEEERRSRREEERLASRQSKPRPTRMQQAVGSRSRSKSPQTRESRVKTETVDSETTEAPNPSREEASPPEEAPTLRRSTRVRKPHVPYNAQVLGGLASRMFEYNRPMNAPVFDDHYLNATHFFDPEEGTVEGYLHGLEHNPWSVIAKKGNDPDLPTWSQAMTGPHAEKFIEAQKKELSQLEAMKTWTVVPRSSVPRNRNIIKSTWAFKIARLPSGEIKKFKSRFCCRGDTQIEGVDVFDTFAPVVSWSTVRMLLILATQLDLKTRACDISNAFVSAPLGPDEEIYVEMPRGFQEQGKVYKLNKSLYGLRQSPKMFFDFLKHKLVDVLKFQQSVNDKCMFFKKDIVVVCWVDDLLCFSKDGKLIDDTLKALEGEFKLTKDAEDEDVFNYLGLEVHRDEDKDGNLQKITLHQPGLIKKILKTIKDGNLVPISESPTVKKPEPIPASAPLGTHKDGKEFSPKEFGFSYSSAVGMLMYLINTRPDLQVSVHQCARFSHSPREVHGKALRRIARYLYATQDQGLMIRKTSGPVRFDCYVDADFAGLFGHEDPQDPMSVKSRTGYVFALGGNPVHWVSKLQQCICLSTVESEYVALSMALREFLPMRQTAFELCRHLGVDVGSANHIKSTVFEDNNGCLSIATAKRLNPRTKHIATVYHWFWAHTGEGSGIKLKKIDTKEQWADMFTKPLDRDTFQTIRKLIMGW